MEDRKRNALEEAGIDVDNALERFMGNEALLERFLKKFLEDTNHAALTAAVFAGDQEAALTAAHTLKGVSGNLSILPLHELLTRQVQLFRENNWEEAVAVMPRITEAYETAEKAIRQEL